MANRRKIFKLLPLGPIGTSFSYKTNKPILDEIMRNLGSEVQFTYKNIEVNLKSENIDIICNIGNGAFGNVHLIRDKETGVKLALKTMKSSFEEGQRRSLMEVNVAAQSKECRYTVDFYGAMLQDGELWMFMEQMDGSLDTLRKNIFENNLQFKMPEGVVGNIVYQVILGLHYLRCKVNVLHRDVKPSNILINRDGRVKICDFGIAGDIVGANSLALSNVGSRPYLAPERIDGPGHNISGYSSRADVWSLGITTLEFTTGRYPYKQWANEWEALNDVVGLPSPVLPDGFSTEFNQFINSCLQKVAMERPRYPNLLEMNFVKKYKTYDIESFVKKYLPIQNFT